MFMQESPIDHTTDTVNQVLQVHTLEEKPMARALTVKDLDIN